MLSERYSRQTSLVNFGAVGQAKLATGRILVVGLGGLGIPVVQYLNAMGVGTLGLMDADNVDYQNLQRQVIYEEKDVGRSKLEVVLERLEAQNSETNLIGYNTFLNPANALEIISNFDLVVDATDNFPTRYLINDACVILDKPFVYGALHGFEGQVSVFNHADGPTYRCLFPTPPNPNEIPNCDENGVLGVVPGIIGTLQALEAVKVLTGVGEVLSGELLVFDGLQQTTRKIKFQANSQNKLIQELQNDYGLLPCNLESTITAEAFLELDTTALQLIDVRTPEEFGMHHLENAINIPLDQLDGKLHQIDFKTQVYLVCQSGKRSEVAQQKLLNGNPKAEIYNIKGGMNKITTLCP